MHPALNEVLDGFRQTVAAMCWLQASSAAARRWFQPFPYIIELSCSPSVSSQIIKVDKNILTAVTVEGMGGPVPRFSRALAHYFRVLTIAVKDVLWEHHDFAGVLQSTEMQFLRHLRNASAHHNEFYWGSGKSRRVPKPIEWRGKRIAPSLEGTKLYCDFFAPGDLFILLTDLSLLSDTN